MSAARGKLSFGGAQDMDARSAPSGSSGVGTIGTTRNRTDLFLKYRHQARGSSKPLAAAAGTAQGCVGARQAAFLYCSLLYTVTCGMPS